MKRSLAAVAVVVVAAGAAALVVPGADAAQPGGGTPRADVTDPAEARRVDRVPAPEIAWHPCETWECASVQLPLDYDDPKGATVTIGLARTKAKDQKRRIGTLFVNPGGPGNTAAGLAASPSLFSKSVLDRFDIVGFDPRGVRSSTQLRCFPTAAEQAPVEATLGNFPMGRDEETAYQAAAKKAGRACAKAGRSLVSSMSTAEAARDMDVLRRAVGDDKLSYLGFSYGTVIGQYYANMFPDRIRVAAIDGVANAASWVGTAESADTVLDDRLRNPDGASRALREILVRCGKVGPSACAFGGGDPVAKFKALTDRLIAKPIYIKVPGATVGVLYTYSYLISIVFETLLYPQGAPELTDLAQKLWTAPDAPIGPQVPNDPDPEYTNARDVFRAVVCTDGRHPAHMSDWPAAMAALDKRAPYFGRFWGWQSAPCARDSWTIRDEDAYTGPFNRRTSVPVLVVGNYYDPATNYDNAVSTSKLLPNSRLLSSDSFGHTAYGTSACVTDAVDAYLLSAELPAPGTVCRGDYQPFLTPTTSQKRVTVGTLTARR